MHCNMMSAVAIFVFCLEAGGTCPVGHLDTEDSGIRTIIKGFVDGNLLDG